MSSGVLFLLTAFAFVAAGIAWSFRDEGIDGVKAYFKTRDGLGVAKGIGISLLVLVFLVTCSGCAGRWLGETSVHAGLEDAGKRNGVCIEGTREETIVSNLGLRQEIFESEDGRYSMAAKYTHHSCAFGEDDKSYDALGAELKYILRK